jgi:hypothetical protein
MVMVVGDMLNDMRDVRRSTEVLGDWSGNVRANFAATAVHVAHCCAVGQPVGHDQAGFGAPQRSRPPRPGAPDAGCQPASADAGGYNFHRHGRVHLCDWGQFTPENQNHSALGQMSMSAQRTCLRTASIQSQHPFLPQATFGEVLREAVARCFRQTPAYCMGILRVRASGRTAPL